MRLNRWTGTIVIYSVAPSVGEELSCTPIAQKGFDREGAKKVGYTDEEIDAYLKSKAERPR